MVTALQTRTRAPRIDRAKRITFLLIVHARLERSKELLWGSLTMEVRRSGGVYTWCYTGILLRSDEMAKVDVGQMTFEEVVALAEKAAKRADELRREKVDEILVERHKDRKEQAKRHREEDRELEKKWKAKAKARGLELNGELQFPARRVKTKARRPARPKYQNADNLDQTWTGKGRKPKWVAAHLEGGGTLEELLIQA